SILSCTAIIAGDVRPDVEELDSTAEIEACLAQVESALKAGRLKLEISGDKVSDDLRARTTSSAKDRAAGVLQRMLAGRGADLDTAHLLASATLSEVCPVKLVREADVGRWFSGRKPATILVAGSSSSATRSDATVNRTYKLGFDPADLPIAYVEVSSGNSKQAIKPPPLGPVTPPGDPKKPKTAPQPLPGGRPAVSNPVISCR